MSRPVERVAPVGQHCRGWVAPSSDCYMVVLLPSLTTQPALMNHRWQTRCVADDDGTIAPKVARSGVGWRGSSSAFQFDGFACSQFAGKVARRALDHRRRKEARRDESDRQGADGDHAYLEWRGHVLDTQAQLLVTGMVCKALSFQCVGRWDSGGNLSPPCAPCRGRCCWRMCGDGIVTSAEQVALSAFHGATPQGHPTDRWSVMAPPRNSPCCQRCRGSGRPPPIFSLGLEAAERQSEDRH